MGGIGSGHYSKHDFEAMYRDYQRGMGLKQVGEKYGCAMQTVHAGFKRAGYKMRPPHLTLTPGTVSRKRKGTTPKNERT